MSRTPVHPTTVHSEVHGVLDRIFQSGGPSEFKLPSSPSFTARDLPSATRSVATLPQVVLKRSEQCVMNRNLTRALPLPMGFVFAGPTLAMHSGDFDRWEARITDYLGSVDDKSKGVAILSQLDDDVYDLARASGINPTTPVAEILRDLRQILCGSTPTWLVRSEFRRRVQLPFESIVEFQQALRLLRRQAHPILAAADVEETLLEQFIDGVSDTEVNNALLRQQPSKLHDALRLAQQEGTLQAACATPLRGCVGVASIRSQSGVDVITQAPWRQCACGSCSPRQTNWRQPPIRRSTGHQGRRSIQVVDV
ncbi:hypothetical protein SprV_0802506500 [Sparganum proliferum]